MNINYEIFDVCFERNIPGIISRADQLKVSSELFHTSIFPIDWKV